MSSKITNNHLGRTDVSTGLAMGTGAILLWSLSSACIVYLGRSVGVWQFLGLAPLVAGILQTVGYVACGRSLRSTLMPPAKLWPAIALGFVLYLLLFTTGLVSSRSETQALGVSLINYLWPMLSIMFTTWLVPGERMHGRLLAAMLLSLAGVLLANAGEIALPGSGISAWPYVLSAAAAISWAAYCALISRWRAWAKEFASAPPGFLIVAFISLGVCFARGEWQTMDARTWSAILLTAIGPWAGGYALWEMSLHRVSSVTLGLMGAATPVLSTINLIALFAVTAPGRVGQTRVLLLLASSFMISASIALGRSYPGNKQRFGTKTEWKNGSP